MLRLNRSLPDLSNLVLRPKQTFVVAMLFRGEKLYASPYGRESCETSLLDQASNS
ncbi:hypothetical protein KOR42_34660 [Thalassoglobus neptunius]|uniref:Uncharacterized protein n=1 Tax=Thalassoglobus neptunius TaxID=1938619 RepID=A0A5C5WLN6_9PLAN|nr:hypothetical protein KOR42_34660 [Thalassoglobus neptunius]